MIVIVNQVKIRVIKVSHEFDVDKHIYFVVDF